MWLTAALLLVSGCSSRPAPTRAEEVRKELAVSLDVRGDVRHSVTDEIRLHIVRVARKLPVFALETDEWLVSERNERFKVGVAITEFEGDGRYTVGATDADAGQLGSFSRGWLELMAKDGSSLMRYAPGPCLVEIASAGYTGSMRCERLEAGEAGAVSVHMTWTSTN